ncbi:MAG: SpaA isopeptide-forming pilin-related protein [Lachnospiraceae bacterium]|nr:SpaA isopeptide-forming pilin-related protein [Lachnospiraceae bacterium]
MDGTYDHNTHTMTWEFKVNPKKMSLTAPVIEDLLPASFVLTSTTPVFINGAEVKSQTEAGGVTPYYNTSMEPDNDNPGKYRQMVKVYMANIDASEGESATKSVTMKTVVANVDEYTDLVSKNTAFDVNNSATLKHKHNSVGATDTGKTKINNVLLKKDKTISTSNVISYTVHINQPQKTITPGMTMTDTLSAGLSLNPDSVKLYKAAVNAAGAFVEPLTLESDFQVTTKAVGEQTVMTVTFPQRTGNKNAYVLKYQAKVMDISKAPYTNHIEGSVGTGTQSSTASVSASVLTTSGGQLGDLSAAVAVKKNPSGQLLAGAVFALQYKGQTIAERTTGRDGKVTFSGLAAGVDYTIVEKTPPTGYQLGTEVWSFEAPAEGAATLNHEFINQPVNSDANGGNNSGNNDNHDNNDDDDDGGSTTATNTAVTTTSQRGVRSLQIVTGSNPQDVITVTDTEVLNEITNLLQLPEGEEKAAAEVQLKEKIRAIMAQDEHFFDNASAEIRAYVLGAMREGQTLPKTGGFWGSGIMYILGLAMMLAGVLVLYLDIVQSRRKHKKK